MLGRRLMEQERFLLAVCVRCIGLGCIPLFTRWALMRVHGNWSRIPRGSRRGIRFLEALMVVGMVAMFVIAYIITQRLEDNRANQEPFKRNELALPAKAQQRGRSVENYSGGASHGSKGRLGTAEEIARAVLVLSTDASSVITGTALVVDGGGIAG